MAFGFGQFARDLQGIQNFLVHLDTLALNDRYSEHVRASKALTLVWMSAAVERFWKSYLFELGSRVAASPVRRRRKHMATSAIFYFDLLGSMKDGKRLKRWGKAGEFFETLVTASPSFTPLIPYDGRTVRPEHFTLAWRIFSLGGTEFPSPVHKQDLNTLADQRNDIAHGIVDPATIGGTLTVGDLRSRLKRLEDVAIHCTLAGSGAWP